MEKRCRFIAMAFCAALLVFVLLVSCGGGGGSTTLTYSVTYNGNGNTGGSVPIDSTNYEQGQIVTVLGNTGTLVKTGYSFAGWNTKTDGNGTTYAQAQTFTIGAANAVLYAKWTANPTYTVTYLGNGNTGGGVPIDSTNYEQGQTVTVLGNTIALVKTGYSFGGWNTQADGSGTSYTQGLTFTMGAANVALYALWTANPTFTVTYDGNGNSSGNVPIDSTHYQQGQTVAALGNTGNLVRIGYAFVGWNTQADGSGITYAQAQAFSMGTADVTLYAKWAAVFTVTYNGNGNTGGNVPIDTYNYWIGSTITIRGNEGSLVKTGYSFAGWNTQADGSGTTYTEGQTFTIDALYINLYAMWTANPLYPVGGTVSGLTGTGLVLQNNGGDDLALSSNGTFTFATQIPDSTTYEVTVSTQPANPGQICTVNNGTGTVSGANVSDVLVTCTSSSAKALTAFSFTIPVSAVIINESAKTIFVAVPCGTDVTALIATFTTTGESVKIGSTTQVSGATANDFTSPAIYEVAAADGSSAAYVVTVMTAAVGDFNGDGKSDLAVANYSGNSISILLGIGDGTFQAPLNYNGFTGPKYIAVGDVDGDMRMDLAVANFDGNSISILVGNGNGTFKTQVIYCAGPNPQSVYIRDFNADGKPDLYVAYSGGGSPSIIVGNGDGTFRAGVISSSADIIKFSLLGEAGTVNQAAKTISVLLPLGTDVTALKAEFELTGLSVKVSGVVQTSGVTVNDFTSPVDYVVTAADGIATKTYTVTVSLVVSKANRITSFSIPSIPALGIVMNSPEAIAVIVPSGTPVTALIATFTTTGESVKVNGLVQTSGTTQNDFTYPVTYVVTAADGSTRSYLVTVTHL